MEEYFRPCCFRHFLKTHLASEYSGEKLTLYAFWQLLSARLMTTDCKNRDSFCFKSAKLKCADRD